MLYDWVLSHVFKVAGSWSKNNYHSGISLEKNKRFISISHLLYPFHMDLQIKILQMSLFVYKYFSNFDNIEI